MPWNPWTELDRRPHITFALAPLPPATGGGFHARWADGSAVIVVDAARRREEQTAILTHELVHDERPSCPWEDGSTECKTWTERDEREVNEIAARRLGREG
jgi:hypothetical protein